MGYHYNCHRHANMYKKSRKNKTKKIIGNQSACTIHGSCIINISKLGEYKRNSMRQNVEARLPLLERNVMAWHPCIPFATSACQGERSYNGVKRWESNLAAVWGQMTTGGGHTSLSNTMSVLGVPVMAMGSFTPTQNAIGEWWR